MYVYVASSWRNQVQPTVCAALASAGIGHYDFRNPSDGEGFSWKQVQSGNVCDSCHKPIHYTTYRMAPSARPEPDYDPYNDQETWRHDGGYVACDDLSGNAWPDPIGAKGTDWVPLAEYLRMVARPVAVAGFESDFDAMRRADAFVMVLPCGKSAHLELGWAAGAGKRTAILAENPIEPELMYGMVDYIAADLAELISWIGTNK